MYKKNEEEESSFCLECGTPFNGRADKKFCSDSCKNRYHNTHYQTKRRMKNRIIACLENNYEILEKLMVLGMDSAELSGLSQIGFNPAYCTGHFKSRGKFDKWCCFDITYSVTPSRIIHISRQDLSPSAPSTGTPRTEPR